MKKWHSNCRLHISSSFQQAVSTQKKRSPNQLCLGFAQDLLYLLFVGLPNKHAESPSQGAVDTLSSANPLCLLRWMGSHISHKMFLNCSVSTFVTCTYAFSRWERHTQYCLFSILLKGDLTVNGWFDAHSELQPYITSSPEIGVDSLGQRSPLLKTYYNIRLQKLIFSCHWTFPFFSLFQNLASYRYSIFLLFCNLLSFSKENIFSTK